LNGFSQVARQVDDEAWRVRILDGDGAVHGAGVLIGGRYVVTAAHVIAQSLGRSHDSGPLTGKVPFDLPMRRRMGRQWGQIIRWRAAEPDGGGDIAGLSVVGPALRTVGEPTLQRVGRVRPRIVRVHGFPRHGHPPGGVTARARLVAYGGGGGEWIQLNRAGEVDPTITYGYSGAGAIDEETGHLLGIALAAAGPEEQAIAWMVPVEKIAEHWPMVKRVLSAQEGTAGRAGEAMDDRTGTRGRLSGADLLRLVERCLRVPELAEPGPRHAIAGELPVEIAFAAPRSAHDRADIAALLWACAQAPSGLTEFGITVLRNAQTSHDLRALSEDLARLDAGLLPKS
jgi:hypothetical protein